MECEICHEWTTAPHRKCEVCHRHFHDSSCGGTYTWSDDFTDYDPAEYWHRGRAITQDQCIVCHRNAFGRHGVAPGPRQWQDALAVYLNRPDLLSEQFQEKSRQEQQRNLKRQKAAAQAAAEAAAHTRQEREYIERRSLHFAPLEPMLVALNKAENALRLLEAEMNEIKEIKKLHLDNLSEELRRATEERDRLAASWRELKYMSRESHGDTAISMEFSRIDIYSRLTEVEFLGWLAAGERDQIQGATIWS